MGWVRVQFGFRSIFRANHVQVGSRFRLIEVWVKSISGGAMVTWFELGMGWAYFESGKIQFNISVNIRLSTNWEE